MITVGVREFRDFFINADYGWHKFICHGMREYLHTKFGTVVYTFNIENRIIEQLSTWLERDFENWYNGIDCTMSEEDMYRWYCIGHQYLGDIGIDAGVRMLQYFSDEHFGRCRPASNSIGIRISRIGLLTDILDKCGDVEFVFNL